MGLDDDELIVFFYQGLIDSDKRLVDSSCGGSILNKSTEDVEKLLSDLSKSSRAYSKTAGLSTG